MIFATDTGEVLAMNLYLLRIDKVILLRFFTKLSSIVVRIQTLISSFDLPREVCHKSMSI